MRCGPEKHGAINNREAQKICGAPESAGPLALAQSAPPLIRPCTFVLHYLCTVFPALECGVYVL